MRWILVSAAAAFAAPATAEEGAIRLTLQNVTTTDGFLVVSVCTEPEHLSGDYGACTRNHRQPATDTEMVLPGVPHGVYAISVFHDVDGDGALKTNFLGIPREPIGASNDARGRFGPPSFEDMKFQLDDEEVALVINLYAL